MAYDTRKREDSRVLLELTRTLISSHDIHDILFRVVKTIAKELAVDRCSIILTRQERDYGFVIVSSDDQEVYDLPIDLSRYPEIMEALEKNSPIIIGDVRTSDLLNTVRDTVNAAGIASSALFPIALEEQAMGVIFLRFKKPRSDFGDREINFCETVANATAIALRNAEIVEKLKEKTKQIESAQMYAERQLSILRRYEDFFLSAADAMLVTDKNEKILYANPRASTITGKSVSSLKETSFRNLFLPEEKNRLTKFLDKMLLGQFPYEVEIGAYGPSGEERIFTLTASALSGIESTFLWTIRDTTETKETEKKLNRAQEQLIQSEKRSAVIELAGAAAHELNQPIQSMLAAVGLVKKKKPDDPKLANTIETMESELDRLAEIVRKIGRITSYETKEYMGTTQILDIDKSSTYIPTPTGWEPPEWMDHAPVPAFFTDDAGHVYAANHALGSVIPLQEVTGSHVSQIMNLSGGAQVWPSLRFLADSPSFPVEIKSQRYTLHFAPYEKGYCGFLVPAPLPVRSSLPAYADSSSGEYDSINERLVHGFIYLAKELNLMMREEELIYLFASTFQTLLPGRLISIRLMDPETMELSLVYANGQLHPRQRNRIILSRKGVHDLALNPDEDTERLSGLGITVSDDYSPVFLRSSTGFDLPLYDGNSLFGLLNIEYEDEELAKSGDTELMIPLARQMTWAVRNAKMVSDSLYLKDYVEKLLDNANAPVIVIDRDRHIEVVNKAVEGLSGFDRADLVDRQIEWLLDEGDQQQMLTVITNALRGESMSNIEVSILRRDSGVAQIAFNTAPILGAFGEVEGIIFVGQDLTELRKLQEQVIHSEKLATLGQLAAGVVHELNNPLTSITVYSNYLLKKMTESGEEAGDIQKVERISEGAERILQFTKALVAYARPSGEKPTALMLGDVVARSVSFCEHLIRKANVKVDIVSEPETIMIYGVEDQLQQVMVNLITNSCHALPSSGGEISIKTEKTEDGRVLMEFSDNGQGIPEEIIEQVFEPFVTTKPVGVGTGLGLSIVRNIIMNHRGEIKVKSEPGRGTTFSIYLYPG